jgi:hypothetical protein
MVTAVCLFLDRNCLSFNAKENPYSDCISTKEQKKPVG